MKRRYFLAIAAVVAALAGMHSLGAQNVLQQRRAFPHEKHAKLFPTCAGCHVGAFTGDGTKLMPPPSLCAECHNGTDSKRVTYTAPAPRHDFLRFVHAEHATRVTSEGRACQACHGARAEAPWMEVSHASPALCLNCHTHRATEHLASDSRCATCHIPLARTTTLTAEHIAAFPKPSTHTTQRFLSNHAVEKDADVAQCATCHTRESCARCHVNAASVPAISKLAPDARVAVMLRGRAATYFTPDDHRAASWENAHGQAANAGTQRCGTCHAQPSCTVCHTGSIGRDVIKRLPDGRSSVPGVQLVLPQRVAPVGDSRTANAAVLPVNRGRGKTGAEASDTSRTTVRPHPVGFDKQHAIPAAAGRLTCEGCHTQRFCSDCHTGASRRRFHVANFVSRHAPDSYGRDQQCQACHNTEVFCRGCHQTSGLASRGARNGAYHNAQPQWLLQHGRAARQGLESCVTCHKQRDCMQCHAETGWGINPHGPDFDARRVSARARSMCARCHITDPLKSR